VDWNLCTKESVKMICDFLYVARSGGHPIMNWAAGLYEEPVQLFNSCEPNGLTNQDPADPLFKHGLLGLPKSVTPDPEAIVFRSFEGPNIFKYDPDTKPDLKIYIMRDPFNLAASQLQKAHKFRAEGIRDLMSEGWVERNQKWWKQMAEEVVIGCVGFISFNMWFENKAYRNFLSLHFFGKDNEDRGLNHTPHSSGLGSSFNGIKMDGRGQQMDVLERYKCWLASETFQAFAADSELRELSSRLFGRAFTDQVYMDIGSAKKGIQL